MMPRVLVVEDEYDVRQTVKDIFVSAGYPTRTAENGRQALKLIGEEPPDIVVSDIFMPEMDGLALLEELRQQNPGIAVVMLTANATADSIIEAIRKGARDYLLKPVRAEELLVKVEAISRMNKLLKENRQLKQKLAEKFDFTRIIGKHSRMLQLYAALAKVAPADTTTLIQGESGTGKELVANALHYNSPRADGPFIKVDTLTVQENLQESELFGHVKGAFTDARADKKGLLEEADGGTLFLDEIGDISNSMQLKLLRFLQTRQFRRVGDTRLITVNVRVIAATNRNLDEALKEKTFREDLFYRLNVITLKLPPLRERKSDIPLLASHFLNIYCEKHHKNVTGIAPETLQILQAYDWPGNVRELENCVERAVVYSESDTIQVIDLPDHLRRGDSPAAAHSEGGSLRERLAVVEMEIIRRALAENNYNKSRTAKKLKINRSTFVSKLSKYNII